MVDIVVRCECGEELRAELSKEHFRESEIIVVPCEKCLEAAKEANDD